LTAASCLQRANKPDEFYAADELKVVMGTDKRTQQQNSFSYDVLDVKTHGRFNRKTFANNLALLKVLFYDIELNF
jgi:hypothetical protein